MPSLENEVRKPQGKERFQIQLVLQAVKYLVKD